MLNQQYWYYDHHKGEWCEGRMGKLSPNQVRIKIKAFGANRADILQIQGLYPPPLGHPDIPGLECSGKIIECGKEVSETFLFRRVMALVPSGAYASHIDIEANLVLPLPETLTYEEGAAIPESLYTAYFFLVELGGMRMGSRVLIFSGAGGVGTMAIQLVRLWGGVPIAVCGNEEKKRLCIELGADTVILHTQEGWQRRLLDQYRNQIDIVLDTLGYHEQFPELIQILARGGRWLLMGLLNGNEKISIEPASFLMKWLTYRGQTIRFLPFYDKWMLTKKVLKLLPYFELGDLKPVVDRVFSYEHISEGLTYLKENRAKGKVVFSWTKG